MNRKFDALGRISIPKEFKDKIGLANNEEAHIELVGNKIIITNPKEFDLESYIESKMADGTDCENMIYQDILNKIRQ